MLIIIIRTLLYYFLILVSLRIMGKREIGELGVNDLIVSILIAQLSSVAIENYKDSLFPTLIPIIIIVLIQLLISFLTLKSLKFRSLVDSKPSIIIKNGILNFKEMERLRYNVDDLLTQIRDKGIKSIDEIEYAILENNGKLSTFLYDNKNIYPMPLILDGIIQYETLNNINKNKIWLMNILRKENTSLENVFYAFYKNNKCFIIKRN